MNYDPADTIGTASRAGHVRGWTPQTPLERDKIDHESASITTVLFPG